MIKQADARSFRLRTKCHMCVTSPPYWLQRLYGDDEREIGQGTLEEYIEDLVTVSLRIWDALDDLGVFWFNLGDKAAGSGGAGGDHNRGGMHTGRLAGAIPKYGRNHGLAPVPDGQWCDVPGRVLHALQDAGWFCRAQIVWDKGHPRRGDYDFRHTKRPGLQTEMIYMLTKHPTEYRFNSEILKRREIEVGNVWSMAPNRDTKNSFAPYPDELVRRCVLLTSWPGDRVLDPFAGSGTTGRVAKSLRRRAVEFDLYA